MFRVVLGEIEKVVVESLVRRGGVNDEVEILS